jgi:hypothetical protein
LSPALPAQVQKPITAQSLPWPLEPFGAFLPCLKRRGVYTALLADRLHRWISVHDGLGVIGALECSKVKANDQSDQRRNDLDARIKYDFPWHLRTGDTWLRTDRIKYHAEHEDEGEKSKYRSGKLQLSLLELIKGSDREHAVRNASRQDNDNKKREQEYRTAAHRSFCRKLPNLDLQHDLPI